MGGRGGLDVIRKGMRIDAGGSRVQTSSDRTDFPDRVS